MADAANKKQRADSTKERLLLLGRVFFSFLKIGIMTFGGGLSMLPLLEREVIDNRRWVTHEEILDYYALGQCTPGIVMVDVSAFIGYKLCGTVGAILVPFGAVLPGVVIITVVAALIPHVVDIPLVASALVGIRIAACALLTVNIYRLVRDSLKKWYDVLLAVPALAAVAVFHVNPAWVLAATVLLYVGLAIGRFVQKKRAAKTAE